jgi:choice-of-anchor C domain-containing protein
MAIELLQRFQTARRLARLGLAAATLVAGSATAMASQAIGRGVAEATAAPPSAARAFSLSIPANHPWVPTQIVLVKGDAVTISASGTWFHAPGYVASPNGASYPCPVGPFLDPHAPCASLIGKIGSGAPFEVGSHLSLSVSVVAPAMLYLSMNDWSDGFSNNSGSLAVKISILTTSTTVNGLITNGCLESPGLQSGLRALPAGSALLPGWSVGGGGVKAVAANYWQPAPGCDQSVDLAGTASGSVSQSVSTVPGESYLLRWEVAGDGSAGTGIKAMAVSWDGALVAAPSFATTGETSRSMGWVAEQLVVTASTATSVLEFADRSAGDTAEGAALGAVSLTASFTA